MIVQEQDYLMHDAFLEHYGVAGMKWGRRKAKQHKSYQKKFNFKTLKEYTDKEDEINKQLKAYRFNVKYIKKWKQDANMKNKISKLERDLSQLIKARDAKLKKYHITLIKGMSRYGYNGNR